MKLIRKKIAKISLLIISHTFILIKLQDAATAKLDKLVKKGFTFIKLG